MGNKWDISIRSLIYNDPQAFVSLVLPGACFVHLHPTRPKDSQLDADVVIEAKQNGQVLIIHIEFQTFNDYEMAERLLRYHVMLYWRYYKKKKVRLPIRSYVIYLLKDGNVASSPFCLQAPGALGEMDEEMLRFHYGSIEIATLRPEDILRHGHPTLLPLLPLTAGGATRAVVEQMFTALSGEKQRETSLIGFLLATLAFKHYNNKSEQKWLEWRFSPMRDILRETPGYQWLVQQERDEGFAKGIEKEREERIEKERQRLRQMVIKTVQLRCPELIPLAEKQVATINSSDWLQDLVIEIGMLKHSGEISRALLRPQSKQ